MSHHSSTPNHELTEAMKQVFGEYPDGKLNPDDAGACSFSLSVENDRVLLRFPKPVSWIGFTGDQAMELATLLMKHARRAGISAPFILRVGE